MVEVLGVGFGVQGVEGSKDSGLVGPTGEVPREQKTLEGHLPRVIYHQVYWYTRNTYPESYITKYPSTHGTPSQSNMSPSILVNED